MKRANQSNNRTNKGTTLIEMVMCFALMAIFISAAAAIIASVTNLYYQVKGETYGRQVSDIIMQRVVAEVEGAKYTNGNNSENPSVSGDKKTIQLYNRSDTKATISVGNNNQLVITYAGFSNDQMSKNDTSWKFDEKVYYNYEIEELLFIPGSAIGAGTSETGTKLQEYGLDSSAIEYESNIVLILMTINSDKYGTYRTVRPVKMYNVPSDYTWPTN